jgi:hypothetical protein
MRVERVTETPAMEVIGVSKEEFDRYGGWSAQMVRRSLAKYIVLNDEDEIIVACGIAVKNFLSSPELWMFMAPEFMRNMRRSVLICRKALREIIADFGTSPLEIHAGPRESRRFAEFLGGKLIARSIHMDGYAYNVYEVAL